MTIEWLAGNRLKGTTAERPEYGTVPSGSVGGWKEIDRTTLDASTTGDVTVSGLGTAGRKRTFMILMDQQSSGITRPNLRINGDGSSNYLYSYSYNGGGNGGNNSSYAQVELSNAEANGVNQFNVVFLTNNSDGDMKQGLSWNIFPNGGGNNSANCTKTAFKWTNTSDAVTSVSLYNDKAGDWDSGSEVVVLEYDENDTHTDNFWVELASEEVGTGQTSTSIDTGTFASKKYLMFQIFTRKSSNGDTRLQFNGDTGVRYTQKNIITNDSGVNTYDYDTDDGLTKMNISGDQTSSGSTEDFFATGFIYNNSANASKLVRGEGVFSAGANSSNIGNMVEFANKYVPATSTDTITSVQVVGTTFLEGSIIKVWGSN